VVQLYNKSKIFLFFEGCDGFLLLGKKYITHVLHLCSFLIRVFFSVLSMVVLIGVLKISWREGACLELGSPDDLGWKLLSVFLEVCFPCYPLSQFS
jgi:hypothetical protein